MKPQEILALEKELNTTFEEVDIEKITKYEKGGNRSTKYTINQDGHIVGLSITEFDLQQIPRIISNCNKLTHLNLSFNYLTDISVIQNFKNLTTINFNINSINDISPVQNLKKLNDINFNGNKITDISPIKELKKLTKINFSHNNHITDISPIQNLKELTSILFIRNQIIDISSIRELNNLTEIYFGSNQIIDISSITKLKELVFIDFNRNKITDIFPIQKLPNLMDISFGNNKIINISPIKELKNLTKVYFGDNPIRNIELSIFKNLSKIDDWYRVLGYYSTIKSPPLEIIKQGKEAILRYFESYLIDNQEVKIILLGNTTVGKTSLVEYLLDKKYPPECSTHGISLRTWQPEDTKFLVSIWDFGGQEYYHATHKLFLTNNAIYLVLWNKDKNKSALLDTDISTSQGVLENKKLQHFHYEYWLKLIRKGFPDSPIITIQNKVDISEKEVIAQNLINQYTVSEQYHISLEETSKGTKQFKRKYDDFEEDLKDFIAEYIKKQAPEGAEAGQIQRYIDSIRKSLRNDWQEDYLSFETFKERAIEVAQQGGDKIDDLDIKITLKYLHDTGVLLYFGYGETMQNSKLKDYVFIKPNYVTDTIYKILDENVQEHGGKFDFEHVKEKLNQNEKEAILFIDLMQSPNFELVFEHKGNYYASQFLAKKNDAIECREDDLEFAFSLRFPNYFSSSFITRFISRYGVFAEKSFFCRTGIILKQNKIDFYIYAADTDKGEIIIKTSEKGREHRFIRKIYDVFLEFADGDRNIEVSIDNQKYAPINHIDKYNLKTYDIERLFTELEYETTIKGNHIQVQGDGNIIIQDVNGSTININPKEELDKLKNTLSGEHQEMFKILQEIKQSISQQAIPAFDIREFIMRELEKLHDRHNKHDVNFDILKKQVLNLETEFKNGLSEQSKKDFEEIEDLILEQNNELAEGIVTALADYIDDSEEITKKHINTELLETYQKLTKKKENWALKVKLAIPLINLLGIDIGTDFEIDLNDKVKMIRTKLKQFFAK